MRDDQFHVLLCCNENFARPAAVAIVSAAENLPRDEASNIHVICHQDPEWFWPFVVETVARVNGRCRLHKIRFPAERFCEAGLPQTVSPMAYGRLLVGELDAEADRILYLDSDTYTLAPLLPIFDECLKDAVVAAVIDHGAPSFPGHLTPFQPPESAPPPYFNSGVLLIDVKRWCSEGISEKTVQFLKAESDRCFYGDQCALNVALLGRWKAISDKWNFQRVQKREVRFQNWVSRVHIVHFLENRKSWNPVFSRTPASRSYFAYASGIGLTGWCPSYAEYLLAVWQRNRPLLGLRLQQLRQRLIPDHVYHKVFRPS